jgi:hypothetical protein
VGEGTLTATRAGKPSEAERRAVEDPSPIPPEHE